MYKFGLLFDFDGLIVDTESPQLMVWQQIYQEYGSFLPKSAWLKCVGTNYDEFDPVIFLSQSIGKSIDRGSLLERQHEASHQVCLEQPTLPGVRELISAANENNVPIAVASSGTKYWVTTHLTNQGLQSQFQAIVTMEDVASVKPAPDLFLIAAEKIGIAPQNCVVLEDSTNGIKAAKAAGMFVIAVPNEMTKDLDFSEADLVINQLSDITLDEINNRFFS